MPEDNDQRIRQRSPLSRGLQALDCLREQPRTVAELAALLAVNRSTAHRLLEEIQAAGYVLRNPVTRQFVLAPEKFPALVPGLGYTEEASTSIIDREWGEVISIALTKLRDLADEATMFTVPAQGRMLYATFFPTDHPIGVQESIGSARPMHASAVGKAYLSTLSEKRLDVVLGQLTYQDGTSRAAKGPFQLRDMIADVRRGGYAVDYDETFEGLSCVATPVFINGRILVGAAGVTGPTHRFTADRVLTYAEFLMRNVRHLHIQ